MRAFFFASCLTLASNCLGQAVATLKIGVLAQVVEVSTDNLKMTGTAFVITNHTMRYLVTAKHLFESTASPAAFDLIVNRSGEWKAFHASVSYSKDYDVAIVSGVPFGPESDTPLHLCLRNTNFNEEMLFLGFPFGLFTDTRGVPGMGAASLPFVKRAMRSGQIDPGNHHPMMVLDAINNPGFSGGPVLVKDDSQAGVCVEGVVSSYRYDEQPIFDDGKHKTGQTTRENSGLMFAVPSQAIVDMLPSK